MRAAQARGRPRGPLLRTFLLPRACLRGNHSNNTARGRWLSRRPRINKSHMAQANRVGGDVDAFCTRCKMELGHTILAMVGSRPARVRCNTCQGEHNYRSEPDAPRKGSWAPKAARARPVVTSWEALLADKDLSKARK